MERRTWKAKRCAVFRVDGKRVVSLGGVVADGAARDAPEFREFLLLPGSTGPRIARHQVGDEADSFSALPRRLCTCRHWFLAYARVSGAVYALSSYPAGLLADRLPQPAVFGIGLTFFAIGYTGLGLTDDPLTAANRLGVHRPAGAPSSGAMF